MTAGFGALKWSRTRAPRRSGTTETSNGTGVTATPLTRNDSRDRTIDVNRSPFFCTKSGSNTRSSDVSPRSCATSNACMTTDASMPSGVVCKST